jgi:hypothetical protein
MEAFKKPPKNMPNDDVEVWLQQWEYIYAECRRINRPISKGFFDFKFHLTPSRTSLEAYFDFKFHLVQ